MFIYNLLLVRVTLSIFFGINYLQPAKRASADSHHSDFYNLFPVVYQRYVRRRPPMYLHDKYMEDIVEIFDTKARPPAYDGLMTDEEVDKFIFCDFNRQLDICKHSRPFATILSSTGSNANPQTATATSTSNHPTLPTSADDIPFLAETEYMYSDENQEVPNKPQENTENYDYYDEKYF